LDLKDRWAKRGLKARWVPRALKVSEGLKALKDPSEAPVSKVRKVRLDLKGPKDPQVHKDRRAISVQQALPVRQVNVVLRANGVRTVR